MKADGVYADRASRRSIFARFERHTDGAAALRVGEHGATFGAGVRFVTSRPIRHAILADDVDVLRRRDLHLVDGEVAAAAGGD